MPGAGCPSIRTKALSRYTTPVACRRHVNEPVWLRTKTLEHSLGITSGWNRIPPTIDPATTAAMILLCEHPASAGCESAQSIQRSSLRRPGAPAGCSRCERSLDTGSGYEASSRVVRPTYAPLLPWLQLLVWSGTGASTAYEIPDLCARPSAQIPSCPVVELLRLQERSGHRSTGDADPLASPRIQTVLEVEIETGAT